MKVVRNRFEDLMKVRGVDNPISRQIFIALDAFDKLALWAMERGARDRKAFQARVSEWISRYKLPRVPCVREVEPMDKQYQDIDDLVRDIKKARKDKKEKVCCLKISEEAYQVLLRWAVEQGAVDKEDMAGLFAEAVRKARLPHRGKFAKSARSKTPVAAGDSARSNNRRQAPIRGPLDQDRANPEPSLGNEEMPCQTA